MADLGENFEPSGVGIAKEEDDPKKVARQEQHHDGHQERRQPVLLLAKSGKVQAHLFFCFSLFCSNVVKRLESAWQIYGKANNYIQGLP